MKLLKLPIAVLGYSLIAIFLSATPAMSQEALRPISPKFTPDPQVYTGNASGGLPLQSVVNRKANGQCQGLTQQSANHSLTLQKNFGFLALKLISDRNLSLLVQGPDGVYCRSGKNPELSGAWMAGKYEIWVGTMNGESSSYQLTISETNQ
ncbi:hypothetical protein [Pseudanabaena sp. 'Roaring Creek']|uniref:hypothetical protein n=1 Tax=Pseudanabaena sp. 'Roaring Creek' TaxID=1681830 RepID=UPI0006D7A92B|nr:hypothetical protein [Pseudanabaena sp. 'Roaring Creek']